MLIIYKLNGYYLFFIYFYFQTTIMRRKNLYVRTSISSKEVNECFKKYVCMGNNEISILRKIKKYKNATNFESDTVLWVYEEGKRNMNNFSVIEQLTWNEINILIEMMNNNINVDKVYSSIYTFFHIYKERKNIKRKINYLSA